MCVQTVMKLQFLTQKFFQCFNLIHADQARFQATPPQDLPLQRDHVGYKHLVDSIDWVQRCADSGMKLVILGRIFAHQQ